MKIVIDPGHGQYSNRGALGYYEGTWMWHLGLYLQRELEARGWQVTNTRPKITDDPALDVRGKMAAGHDLLISVHSNAPGSGEANYSSIRGATIYDSVADRLDYLEQPLVALIAEIMGTPNLGVKLRYNTRVDRQGQDYYGVLRNAVTEAGCQDAMLIEHGYHTNEQDARWLMNHDNLKRLAAAEVELIDRLWREKHGIQEDSTMLKLNDKGEAVYDYQSLVKALGYDTGAWKNMYNGQLDGRDGSYGPFMEKLTKQIQTEYKLEPTGIVDAALYGKLAIAALARNTGISQAQLEEAKEQLRLEQDATARLAGEVSSYKGDLVKLAQARKTQDAILAKY